MREHTGRGRRMLERELLSARSSVIVDADVGDDSWSDDG